MLLKFIRNPKLPICLLKIIKQYKYEIDRFGSLKKRPPYINEINHMYTFKIIKRGKYIGIKYILPEPFGFIHGNELFHLWHCIPSVKVFIVN